MTEVLKNYRFLRYQGPMIFWAVALFTQSSLPSYRIPDLSIFTQDKLIHFIIYVIFAATVHRAITHQATFTTLKRHQYVFTILIVAVYGASDEIHQYFVPTRSCSLLDWIADVTGSLVFVVFHYARAKLKPTAQSS